MDRRKDIVQLLETASELFRLDGHVGEREVLESAVTAVEEVGFDSWNGGTDMFSITLDVPVAVYAKHEKQLPEIEEGIRNRLAPMLRRYPDVGIASVVVVPHVINTSRMAAAKPRVRSAELVEELDALKGLLIAVSTGGPRIQSVNDEYVARLQLVDVGLGERQLENPIPYADLWAWYGKWSSGDLPSYQSRRDFIGGLLDPLIRQLRASAASGAPLDVATPTGWARVDRSIGEIRVRLGQASTEEQYQAIGLFCRETLISLAQEVYVHERHILEEGVVPSQTDAKRMLQGFLIKELAGGSNEIARRHAKAALDLANELAHLRTATFRDAALCAEATSSVVNIVAIVSGHRDPE